MATVLDIDEFRLYLQAFLADGKVEFAQKKFVHDYKRLAIGATNETELRLGVPQSWREGHLEELAVELFGPTAEVVLSNAREATRHIEPLYKCDVEDP
jgi:hypothetical protein